MNGRVVIVDDEPTTRFDIRDILQGAGYEVVGEAADGFEVIEICKKTRPDVVLMDIQMPVLDGLKAGKKLFRTIQPAALCFYQPTVMLKIRPKQRILAQLAIW